MDWGGSLNLCLHATCTCNIQQPYVTSCDSQLIIERAMVPVCGGRVDTPWSAIGEIGDTTLPFQVAQSEPSLVGGFRGGLDWRLGAGGGL